MRQINSMRESLPRNLLREADHGKLAGGVGGGRKPCTHACDTRQGDNGTLYSLALHRPARPHPSAQGSELGASAPLCGWAAALLDGPISPAGAAAAAWNWARITRPQRRINPDKIACVVNIAQYTPESRHGSCLAACLIARKVPRAFTASVASNLPTSISSIGPRAPAAGRKSLC